MLFRRHTHDVLAGLDRICIQGQAGQSFKGKLQQTFVANERHKLLGETLAAKRPQTCARPTTQNDWRNFHFCAPDRVALTGKKKALTSFTDVNASSPAREAKRSLDNKNT